MPVVEVEHLQRGELGDRVALMLLQGDKDLYFLRGSLGKSRDREFDWVRISTVLLVGSTLLEPRSLTSGLHLSDRTLSPQPPYTTRNLRHSP